MIDSSLIDTDGGVDSIETPPVFRFVARQLKWAAFWAAVVLPVLHLSLLATGLDSQSSTLAFLVLVCLNVVALYIGHPYQTG
jgi:O-antigen ligase